MRWLFFLLLLVNVIAYFWFGSTEEHRLGQRDKRVMVANTLPGDIRPLKLVHESEVVREKKEVGHVDSLTIALVNQGVEVSQVEIDTEGVEPEPEDILVMDVHDAECMLIGPWADRAELEKVQTALANEKNIHAELHDREEIVSQNYWLIVPPTGESEARELWDELQHQNIESFIIADGEFKNGITLGVFRDRENTRKYQREIMALGFRVDIKPLPRTAISHWLLVKAGPLPFDIDSFLQKNTERGDSIGVKPEVVPCDKTPTNDEVLTNVES